MVLIFKARNKTEEKYLYKANMESVSNYENIANNDNNTNISQLFIQRLEISKEHKSQIMVAS